jgi:hypothetical protein
MTIAVRVRVQIGKTPHRHITRCRRREVDARAAQKPRTSPRGSMPLTSCSAHVGLARAATVGCARDHVAPFATGLGVTPASLPHE